MTRGVLLTASLLAALPGAVLAQPDQTKVHKAGTADTCFYITQVENDLPINDHTVLFRVNVSDIYALDFADRCAELTFPSPRLIITPVGGIGLICHAIDVDVKVGQNGGPGDIPTPCIPTGLRKLTPAEIAALPKKDRP
jgi:hypothetical protein